VSIIASQYIRGRVVPQLPPYASGVMSITKGFAPESISEEVEVSTTPTASESISAEVEVTVT